MFRSPIMMETTTCKSHKAVLFDVHAQSRDARTDFSRSNSTWQKKIYTEHHTVSSPHRQSNLNKLGLPIAGRFIGTASVFPTNSVEIQFLLSLPAIKHTNAANISIQTIFLTHILISLEILSTHRFKEPVGFSALTTLLLRTHQAVTANQEGHVLRHTALINEIQHAKPDFQIFVAQTVIVVRTITSIISNCISIRLLHKS